MKSQHRWLERGQGEPVVLLHGLMGQMHHWDDVLDELGGACRAMAPTLPIFDPGCLEPSIDLLARWVVDFLDALEIPRAVIGGNSLGGHVALATALAFPERVRAVILTGSSGLFERSFTRGVPHRPTADYLREKMEEVFFDRTLVTPEWVESVRCTLIERASVRRVLGFARAAKRDNLEARLVDLAAPTLIVWGAEDRITPLDVGRRFHALIPGSSCVRRDRSPLARRRASPGWRDRGGGGAAVVARIGGVLLDRLADRRRRALEALARRPMEAQRAALLDLVRRAEGTRFGRSHDFAGIRSIEDYQARVGVGQYLDFRPLWTRVLEGERDVTWPGRPRYWTKTSGTTAGDKTIGSVVSRANGHKASVIVTSDGFADWSTEFAGIRSLGNNTPIMNSWAGDGTFWYPKGVKVSNYWYPTYASVFGDDPNPAVKKLIGQMKAIHQPPATGGFVQGAAAIDGIVAAITRAHGSTKGSTLAAIMVKFHNLPTISGNVSFSPKLHSVFGRAYRIMEVENSKPKFVQLYTAKKLGSL